MSGSDPQVEEEVVLGTSGQYTMEGPGLSRRACKHRVQKLQYDRVRKDALHELQVCNSKHLCCSRTRRVGMQKHHAVRTK